jgi:hypothetical protein
MRINPPSSFSRTWRGSKDERCGKNTYRNERGEIQMSHARSFSTGELLSFPRLPGVAKQQCGSSRPLEKIATGGESKVVQVHDYVAGLRLESSLEFRGGEYAV